MSAKISIIIPNFNNEKYLDDCLWSVQNQTFHNWNAIVVDDASADNSKDIIKRYAESDNRFNPVFLDKNQGLSRARNIGLDISKNDYVTFLDSDDCMDGGALGILYSLSQKYNADAVKAQRERVQDNFNVKSAAALTQSYGMYIVDNPSLILSKWFKAPMSVWLYLYRKDVLDWHKFMPDMRPGEDILFTTKALMRVQKLVITEYKSVFYRISSTSILDNHTTTSESLNTVKKFLSASYEIFNSETNFSESYEKICKRFSADLFLLDSMYRLLFQNAKLIDMASNNVKAISDSYDIAGYYNLRTKLAIQAFAKHQYGLSRFLVDRSYFEKYFER